MKDFVGVVVEEWAVVVGGGCCGDGSGCGLPQQEMKTILDGRFSPSRVPCGMI